MSQLRENRLTGQAVVISENRGQRPIQLAPQPNVAEDGPCPFCAGNESETPPAVRVYPAEGPWQVRVVPNKYPAVESTPPDPPSGPRDKLFSSRANYGRHEVVIESRDHLGEFGDVSPTAAAWTFQAYRDRMAELHADPLLNHVQVFRNSGSTSGASIYHVHSQILATQVIPAEMRRTLDAARDWAAENDECLLCRMLADERRAGQRVVRETARFVAFCPFASCFPYETWIVPRRHAPRFELSGDADLAELAALTQDILARLRRTLGSIAYNSALFSAPPRDTACDDFHWHWRILPRVTMLGGYELATGLYINTVSPEDAARRIGGGQ